MNSNPSTVILSFVAGSTNGYATSQAVAGAGNLTLNGSLVTSSVGIADRARRVIITSANAGDTTQTVTVTGTNQSGATISNSVTLNGTAGIVTALDFATVTQIALSAATAGNITAGTSTGATTALPIGSSVWQVDNFLSRFWALAGGITGPAGTSYTLECTYDDPNDIGSSLVVAPQQFAMNPASFIPPHVYPHPTIANVSGDNQFDYANHPIFAHRLTINSGTGQVVMQSIQAGPTG